MHRIPGTRYRTSGMTPSIGYKQVSHIIARTRNIMVSSRVLDSSQDVSTIGPAPDGVQPEPLFHLRQLVPARSLWWDGSPRNSLYHIACDFREPRPPSVVNQQHRYQNEYQTPCGTQPPRQQHQHLRSFEKVLPPPPPPSRKTTTSHRIQQMWCTHRLHTPPESNAKFRARSKAGSPKASGSWRRIPRRCTTW